ncbi:hypothetical protein L932_04350 [Helicobacter pylori PZ5026]|nr:hypothetical protein L932_04350 [Helicobacter pylori PZ5026]
MIKTNSFILHYIKKCFELFYHAILKNIKR